MKIARLRGLLLAGLLLPVFVMGTATPAYGQVDLRREAERLRTQVTDLSRELAAAKAEIERLTKENLELRQQMAAGGSGSSRTLPPLTPDPVSIDESTPMASPRALLAALIEEYGKATAELEIGTDRDDARRIAYLRQLDRWVKGINRKFHKPIEWPVRIFEEPVPAGQGYRMKCQVVDPETDVTIGDPFYVLAARNIGSRLERLRTRLGHDTIFTLKGTLVPRVRLNDMRLEKGPFDNPRFIGPFAEFEMSVVASAVMQPKKKKDEPAPDAGAATPGGEQSASEGDGDRP